jgi:hypothetical protein
MITETAASRVIGYEINSINNSLQSEIGDLQSLIEKVATHKENIKKNETKLDQLKTAYSTLTGENYKQ